MSSVQSVRTPSPEMLADTNNVVIDGAQRLEAIRLVSLPVEIQTGDDVFQFMKNILRMEAVSVYIVQMQTDSGIRYRSAFADIVSTGEEDPQLIHAIMDGNAVIRNQDIPGGIHFDNGKPMSHIKIMLAKKHAPSKDPLQLVDGEWSSIYVPVIPNDLTMDNGDMRYNEYDTLVEFFEDQLKIGEVSRIDFMSKIVPGTEREVRCAYVHFEKWYDNNTAKLVRKTINEKGEFSCNGFYDGFEFRRFERNRYITFKVNHKPIPAVTEDLNVHQLVARIKMLEEQNALLEQQSHNTKPLTMEQAFKQLQDKMEQFKVVSNELTAKYGSNDNVNEAGVFETPEYEEYNFDYITAINELYSEFVPIIWRDCL